jgi:type VI protein secretion system component VasK
MDFWSFFWLLVWSFFFVAYLMLLFHIFADLFRDGELGGFAKVVWVVVLFVVPLLASLIYIIVRGKGMAEREMERNSRQMAAQEDYIRSVTAASGSTSSTVEQLSQAKALLDSGAITEAEFAAIKSKALA